MKNNFLPEGFQTLSPYFCVENAKAFIDFLERAFNAETLYAKIDGGNLIEHALLQIGNSYLEISDAKATFPANSFSFQLFVENCDETYARALEQGAISIGEPSDKPYGVRAGYARDAWGNQWYISTQIKNRYKPAFWKILQDQYQ